MKSRRERLRHLLDLQRTVQALHEMRHAGFLAEARAAEEETSALIAAADGPDSLASLFPDIYARRIAAAGRRRDEALSKAAAEAGKVSVETVRTSMVERSFGQARRQAERERSEKDVLEAATRNLPRSK